MHEIYVLAQLHYFIYLIIEMHLQQVIILVFIYRYQGHSVPLCQCDQFPLQYVHLLPRFSCYVL